jgi:hypothetical protein
VVRKENRVLTPMSLGTQKQKEAVITFPSGVGKQSGNGCQYIRSGEDLITALHLPQNQRTEKGSHTCCVLSSSMLDLNERGKKHIQGHKGRNNHFLQVS